MSAIISSFTVERFRSLQSLKLENLGRVNLITGRNNCGKSSVLEALRILASAGRPEVLYSILQAREEDSAGNENTNERELNYFGSFFNGFPQIPERGQTVVLSADRGKQCLKLALSVGWFSEERDPEGLPRWVEQQPSIFPMFEGVPALIIESQAGRRVRPLAQMKGLPNSRYYGSDLADEPPLPLIFVSPYGGEHTANLGALWDSVALSDRETDVINALKIVAGDITKVSMIGGEASRKRRTAIVRSSEFPNPVPLRSYGDGLNRLFGIVLSLVNAKDGFLLIDEFENGMHHTVQLDVWRIIFRLARQLNTQVFATSHSWDAIESFQQAAAEEPDEALLIRLSKHEGSIVPTLFRKDELAIVTRNHIEVR